MKKINDIFLECGLMNRDKDCRCLKYDGDDEKKGINHRNLKQITPFIKLNFIKYKNNY